MATLALVTSRFPFGSKEAFLREEIEELARRHRVIIFPALPTNEPSSVPSLNGSAERLRLLSLRVLADALAEFARSPGTALRAFTAVVSRPRAMHARLKNAAIFPTALSVARRARAAGVDHIHGYWLSTPATIAYVVSVVANIPWSASGHRYDLVDFNIRTVNDPHPGFLDDATFVRVISEQGTARVRTALRHHERLLTGHLGVRLPPSAAEPTSDDTLRLICAANLERVKGHASLLDALARARSQGIRVRCTLAGDGTERKRIEETIEKRALQDSVVLEGVVPHATLLRRIAGGEFDAAILTSIDEGPNECEGIPVSLMEAMAAGLPVIATASGAIPELVSERNGLLCAPGDAEAIGDSIVRLARDAALRRRLGAAARETIALSFNVEANARLFQSLMNEPIRQGATA